MKLNTADSEIYTLINKEKLRQEQHLEMIASENHVNIAIMEAQGSILTNKYAEGYPGKRYYGGCEYVDAIENLAIERAKSLFGCKYANVQAHSGSQANFAVFTALLKPMDKILGLDLTAGGHLTHGCSVNYSGLYFESHSYSVNENGLLDYDEILSIAKKVRPKILISGFSAYSRLVDWQKLQQIAHSVGAIHLVDMAHISGLIAGKAIPSPVPYADVITSTTQKTLRGPRGGLILTNDLDIAKKINKALFPGTQGGPLMHAIAAKATCFKLASTPEFAKYAKQVIVNAKSLANSLLNRGIDLVTGGTDNHLLLLSLRNKDLTGKELERVLESANIVTNKNTIPNDERSPFVTSGVRIGTPALTTRGMGILQMQQIGEMIADLVNNQDNATIEYVKRQVLELTLKFPIYEK